MGATGSSRPVASAIPAHLCGAAVHPTDVLLCGRHNGLARHLSQVIGVLSISGLLRRRAGDANEPASHFKLAVFGIQPFKLRLESLAESAPKRGAYGCADPRDGNEGA